LFDVNASTTLTLLVQVNVLYDTNVPPSTISKIMSTLREDDKGTFLPKTIFQHHLKKQEPTEHGEWNTAINDQG
jgi:hypothetical protein